MSRRGTCPGCGREVADQDDDAIHVEAGWSATPDELDVTAWYHWHCTSVAALDPVHGR